MDVEGTQAALDALIADGASQDDIDIATQARDEAISAATAADMAVIEFQAGVDAAVASLTLDDAMLLLITAQGV